MTAPEENAQVFKEICIPQHQNHHGKALRLIVPWVCLECGQPRGNMLKAVSTCDESGATLEVDVWLNHCGHIETYQQVRESMGL